MKNRNKVISYKDDWFKNSEDLVNVFSLYFYISKRDIKESEVDCWWDPFDDIIEERKPKWDDEFLFIWEFSKEYGIYKGGQWEVNYEENEDDETGFLDYIYSFSASPEFYFSNQIDNFMGVGNRVFQLRKIAKEFYKVLHCLYHTDYDDIIGCRLELNGDYYEIHELDEALEKIEFVEPQLKNL